MSEHIDELLAKATGPMSFAVVVPDWPRVAALEALSRSPWLRRSWALTAEEHGFVDGRQHESREHFRPSSFGTRFFILQNDLGAKKWRATAGVEAALNAAMRQAKPAKSLQEWEGRAGGGGRPFCPAAKNAEKRKEQVDAEAEPAQGRSSKRLKKEPDPSDDQAMVDQEAVDDKKPKKKKKCRPDAPDA